MNHRNRFWLRRTGGFFLTIMELCAIGGLLGGLVFPLAGRFGGSQKTLHELIVAGVKSGAFIFMVWAPGAALVREFVRGAKERKSPQAAPSSRSPAN